MFPDTPAGCLAEKAQLVIEVRRIAEAARDADNRALTAEEQQEVTRKMERVKNLATQAKKLQGERDRASSSVLIAELDRLDAEGDETFNQRRTSPDNDDLLNIDEMMPQNARVLRWQLGNRSRGGRPINRSFFMGTNHRSTADYRMWNRSQICGGERRLLGPDGKPWSAPENLLTTIQVGEDVRAGYFTLSEQMTAEILRNVDDDVFIQQWANVTYIPKARTIGIRKRLTKADSFIWGSELSDATLALEKSLTYGKRVMEPNFLVGSFRLSNELIRIAEINIEQEVINELMIDLREFLEVAYLTGDGNRKPLGLLTASSEGISTARDTIFGTTATKITFDAFIKAKYMLKDKYRRKAFYIMHPDRVVDLALLRNDSGATTSTGDYLWQPSRLVGEPDVICGMPLRESYFMPNATGTGNYFCILGDMSFYRIIIAMDLEMRRLTELRARTNETEYLFRMKLDAQPVMDEAFVRMAYGT